MKLSDLPLKPTARTVRQFAAAWLVVFTAIAVYEIFQGQNQRAAILAAIAGAGIAGMLWPRTFKWLFIVATLATFPIGWLLSHILLALIFYLIITPIGIILRLSGRDSLQLRRPRNRDTFWVERRESSKPENYLKQF